ncbi:MAG: hypothetical protein MJZ94_02920 [Bacteroidales bacterium]|nr:hypothetical protein [Bacteroidales bacterium]
MKLGAVVVVFNPEEDVVDNISSYAQWCDYVIIWDNSPSPIFNMDSESLKLTMSIPDHTPFQYVSDGSNYGLAHAYNCAIDIFRNYGCTHLMTMDQDSRFENFVTFRKRVEMLEKEKYILAPVINSFCDDTQNELISANDVAQSGCVHPLSMIDEVGLFREDFFIGMVDVEMQLKAVEKGYRVFQIGGCNMIHQIGSGRTVNWCGKIIHLSDYGPLRHYYDSRNRILMWKEFPYDISFHGKIKHLIGRLSLCIKIFLFEDRKFAKIISIIRGTFNGLFNIIKPY